MATREILWSSASNSSSGSSSSSYYGCNRRGTVSDNNNGRDNVNKRRQKTSAKPLTLFDDVKIILSRHDRKLSKLEEDLNITLNWLSKKFGFGKVRYGSTLSLHTDLDEPKSPEGKVSSLNEDLQSESEEHKLDVPGEATIILIQNQDFGITESNNVEEENYYNDLQDDTDLLGSAFEDSFLAMQDDSCQNQRSIPKLPIKRSKRIRKPKSSALLNNDVDPHLPIQCDICGKFLKDPTSLRQHKQIHLNIRPFVCPKPECGKSFRRKFHMQTHLLIHSGVKKHQCGYCGRLFLLQKDLVSHERIHTGERPFTCPDCPKSFNLKSHLVMHSRTHTGEKPYKCNICSKYFAQSNSLRLHKKKVHRENNGPTEPRRKQAQQPNKKSTNTRKVTGTKLDSVNTPSTSSPLSVKIPIYKN